MATANQNKSIQIGNYSIGGDNFTIIGGPCSVESFAQTSAVAQSISDLGLGFLRGGTYKLRTNPESFQGLGAAAFDIIKEVKAKTGLLFVSEITDPRQVESFLGVVDVFQVGSRNMHNYALLKELGGLNKPVLLKRGFSGLIKEWLLSAEYIATGGNPNVILCERGIRTFETATRNTLDLNAVAYVKNNSSFPVIVDPSHGTGSAELVTPLSLAAAAVGADGIMVEVHPEPQVALSDGFQALTIPEFEKLVHKIEVILPHLGKRLSRGEEDNFLTNDSLFEPIPAHQGDLPN